MNKKRLFALIGIALVLVILGVVGKKQGWFGKKGDFKTVEISKIERIEIVETVSATGKIQPEVEVKLSSEVSGEIIALPIVEGQQVKKGDLLVSINPDIYKSVLERSQASLQNVRANLGQADASLKEATSNYERNKGLFEKGVISKAEWDRIIAAYEGSKASKQSAYYNVQSALASVSEAKDNFG